MKNNITFVVVIAIAITLFFVLQKLTPSSDEATLQHPMGGPVQMWAEPGSGADSFAQFPVGTVCTNLYASVRVKWEEGMYSTFDKLTCQDQSGYVNAKFVDR